MGTVEHPSSFVSYRILLFFLDASVTRSLRTWIKTLQSPIKCSKQGFPFAQLAQTRSSSMPLVIAELRPLHREAYLIRVAFLEINFQEIGSRGASTCAKPS